MKYRMLERSELYRGYFRLERYAVRHDCFDGGSHTISREVFERGDAAAAVLYDPRQDLVVLTEQFRIGPMARNDDPWLLETVAGIVAPDEAPEDCIRRECVEEAGFDPQEIRPLGSFYSSPGGSSERMFLYLATIDLQQPAGGGGGVQAEHEDIRLHIVSRETALSWVKSGKIRSGGAMLALLLAFPPG